MAGPIRAAYVAADQFKVGGDRTAAFVSGRRIKADQGADGVEYFTVESSSLVGSTTYITVKETTVTTNLEQVLYSVVAPGAAGGLPVHDHSDEDQGGAIATGGSSIERWRLWFGA